MAIDDPIWEGQSGVVRVTRSVEKERKYRYHEVEAIQTKEGVEPAKPNNIRVELQNDRRSLV